jgi:serine/threonine-protein kinase
MADEAHESPDLTQPESPRPKSPARLIPLIVAVAAVALLAVVAVLFRPVVRAPQGGTTGAPGAAVAAVPDVSGDSTADAHAALAKAGFSWVEASVPDPEKTPGEVVAQYPLGGANLHKGAAVALQVSGGTTVTTSLVPNVVGMARDGAHAALSSAGFVSAVLTVDSAVPAGQVVAQMPAGGDGAETGSAVVISVSSGSLPGTATVAVPDVTGSNGAAADRAIRRAGFNFQTAESFSATVPEGTVIFQVPAAGTMAPSGAVVAAVISIGPNPQQAGTGVSVPQVAGRSLPHATEALSGVGLLVVAVPQPSTTKSPNTVLGTLPSGGASVVSGTKVLVIYATEVK